MAAIEKGFVQTEIQNAAYEFQRSVEEGRQIVVGVNKFQVEEHESLKPFQIDPELESQQVERLRAVRTSRSQADQAASLSALKEAARGADNLMPHILNCCRRLATVGEISDTLRTVFGEYRETF